MLTAAGLELLFLFLARLYDLAVQPKVAQALREEMRRVLGENGGVMTTKALQDMKLTDSFMKESQRLNPAFLTAFLRATVKPVTLSDGTYIPKDTFVCSPNTILQDEELYPNPEVRQSPHSWSVFFRVFLWSAHTPSPRD